MCVAKEQTFVLFVHSGRGGSEGRVWTMRGHGYDIPHTSLADDVRSFGKAFEIRLFGQTPFHLLLLDSYLRVFINSSSQ